MPMPVTLLLVFASVTLLVAWAMSFALSASAPGRRRLRRLAQNVEKPVEALDLTDRPNRVLTTVARVVRQSPETTGRLRAQLANAGYRSHNAVVAFRAAQVLIPAALGIVALLFVGFGRLNIVALTAGVGFFVPRLVLRHQSKRRMQEIEHGLPDTLDLLVVCLEAGCTLDQAIIKASNELALAYPAVADELTIVRSEVRAGKPRLEAFRHFAERTRLSEVRSLVAMLGQTDRFGTSIAQALRVHAQTARNKRRQQAEERAAKAGVKLVFPLVLCLFPAFYAITLGPAVIQFADVFFGEVAQRIVR